MLLSGQDQCGAIKRRLKSLLPECRAFLDVDDLQSIEGLEEHVAESASVLVFLSHCYFESHNCRREVLAALQHRSPIILVHEMQRDKSTPLAQLRASCVTHCGEHAISFAFAWRRGLAPLTAAAPDSEAAAVPDICLRAAAIVRRQRAAADAIHRAGAAPACAGVVEAMEKLAAQVASTAQSTAPQSFWASPDTGTGLEVREHGGALLHGALGFTSLGRGHADLPDVALALLTSRPSYLRAAAVAEAAQAEAAAAERLPLKEGGGFAQAEAAAARAAATAAARDSLSVELVEEAVAELALFDSCAVDIGRWVEQCLFNSRPTSRAPFPLPRPIIPWVRSDKLQLESYKMICEAVIHACAPTTIAKGRGHREGVTPVGAHDELALANSARIARLAPAVRPSTSNAHDSIVTAEGSTSTLSSRAWDRVPSGGASAVSSAAVAGATAGAAPAQAVLGGTAPAGAALAGAAPAAVAPAGVAPAAVAPGWAAATFARWSGAQAAPGGGTSVASLPAVAIPASKSWHTFWSGAAPAATRSPLSALHSDELDEGLFAGLVELAQGRTAGVAVQPSSGPVSHEPSEAVPPPSLEESGSGISRWGNAQPISMRKRSNSNPPPIARLGELVYAEGEVAHLAGHVAPKLTFNARRPRVFYSGANAGAESLVRELQAIYHGAVEFVESTTVQPSAVPDVCATPARGRAFGLPSLRRPDSQPAFEPPSTPRDPPEPPPGATAPTNRWSALRLRVSGVSTADVRISGSQPTADFFLLLLNRAGLAPGNAALKASVGAALEQGLHPLVLHDLRATEVDGSSSFSDFQAHMSLWRLMLGSSSRQLFQRIASQLHGGDAHFAASAALVAEAMGGKVTSRTWKEVASRKRHLVAKQHRVAKETYEGKSSKGLADWARVATDIAPPEHQAV